MTSPASSARSAVLLLPNMADFDTIYELEEEEEEEEEEAEAAQEEAFSSAAEELLPPWPRLEAPEPVAVRGNGQITVEGCPGRIQDQYQSGECVFKEESPHQRKMAALWLFVLLLHPGLQSVARCLSYQKNEKINSEVIRMGK